MDKRFLRANEHRVGIARHRLFRVLERHGIATARTLEQKISDAGPFNLRIDPHVLTIVRNHLVQQDEIRVIRKNNTPWFYLNPTPKETVRTRLAAQLPILQATQKTAFTKRLGQALEIATYRALLQQNYLDHLGSFVDLESHDDSKPYKKEDPPRSLNGNHLSGDGRLDFLVRHPEAAWAGIEVKNVRPWIYPAAEEVTDLLLKALELDCVPVLIARRFPFVTFKVLSQCGMVFHQTYNQLYAQADEALSETARDKSLLGYHDIRVGNHPDKRLCKFITTNLPKVLPEAREKFKDYKDLIGGFVYDEMNYREFAARVRRRSKGSNEDNDWEELPDEELW